MVEMEDCCWVMMYVVLCMNYGVCGVESCCVCGGVCWGVVLVMEYEYEVLRG